MNQQSSSDAKLTYLALLAGCSWARPFQPKPPEKQGHLSPGRGAVWGGGFKNWSCGDGGALIAELYKLQRILNYIYLFAASSHLTLISFVLLAFYSLALSLLALLTILVRPNCFQIFGCRVYINL